MRLYQYKRVNALTLRVEQNSYYYTIRRAKRQCWAAFQEESDEILGDSDRYCTALKYSKPWALSSTSGFKDPEGNTPTSLEYKAEMVQKTAFPAPPANLIGPPLHWESTDHQRVDEYSVRKLLFD